MRGVGPGEQLRLAAAILRSGGLLMRARNDGEHAPAHPATMPGHEAWA
jgi:hypothetical protein